MLFILLILIHFSITISRLYQMNKKIAQELALMKHGDIAGQDGEPYNTIPAINPESGGFPNPGTE